MTFLSFFETCGYASFFYVLF